MTAWHFYVACLRKISRWKFVRNSHRYRFPPEDNADYHIYQFIKIVNLLASKRYFSRLFFGIIRKMKWWSKKHLPTKDSLFEVRKKSSSSSFIFFFLSIFGCAFFNIFLNNKALRGNAQNNIFPSSIHRTIPSRCLVILFYGCRTMERGNMETGLHCLRRQRKISWDAFRSDEASESYRSFIYRSPDLHDSFYLFIAVARTKARLPEPLSDWLKCTRQGRKWLSV